ncbi:MAG: transcriptional regulator with XRE-family HTH domain [Paraglaciecola sp.]|jgi:transcriptional regulator with XRE-family HTH domain
MNSQQITSKIYLSDNIRFLRKQKDLSQEELASNVGLNRGNIASYEKGTAEPKLCNLLSFSKYFEVTLLDLTQRDLQNFGSVPVSPIGTPISQEEKPMLDEYLTRAGELNEVLEGLNCYHCYKKKSFDDMPKEQQMLVSNFEKLFEVAQVLMDSHKELLAFVQSKCPKNSV